MARTGGLNTLVSNPEVRPNAVEREAGERQRDQARHDQMMQLIEKDAGRSKGKLGELLSDVHENMSDWDKAALYTALIPGVGDIVGAVADTRHLIKDPSLTNAGFLLAGLLPFVPSGGITRNLRQALPQAPNYLKPFYSGKRGAKLLGVGEGTAKGLVNLAEARYSPKARGIFREHGVSVADTKIAKKAMKDFKDPKIPEEKVRKSGKQAIGQFRQTTLMGQQYKHPSKFHKISEGLDEVAFGNFNANDYHRIMGGATGLRREDLNSVFKHIGSKDIQNINPGKNYQMTVRRSNTQAAGNLDNFAFQRPIFGGSTVADLRKNVFKGKKFKSNEEFLEALQAHKVRVRNPEEVLKGRPAIVTGSVNSDAVELGGVNYMSAIKKDGTLVSFMSDEHDLFKMKLPKGERMISISTPITIDILKKKDKVKRISSKVARSQKTLLEAKRSKAKEVIEELSKYPGVDITLPTPKGMTKAQFYAIQAVANMSPANPDYSRILKDVGMFAPVRAAKTITGSAVREKKKGGSVMERNPYDYKPKAI